MDNKKNVSYLDSVHRDGRIWGFSLLAILFLFPVVVSLVFSVVPDWAALAKGALAVAPMYWAVGIIEVITYVPMLGAGGAYLSFVTGNISNLKLPCALDAMEKADVKPNSEEGEIISTISIAVSSIVTTVIVILGVGISGAQACLCTDAPGTFWRSWSGIYIKECKAVNSSYNSYAGTLYYNSRTQLRHCWNYGSCWSCIHSYCCKNYV